jgi:hypothetical protein
MSAPRFSGLSALTARRDAAGLAGRSGAGAADPRTSRARLVLCALALGLAPILLVIASLVSLSTSDDAARQVGQIAADRGRFLAGNLLFALGGAALIPGAIALAHLARARGAAWMTTGASMIAVGGGSLAVALWSYTAVGYLGTASGVPRDGVISMLDRGQNSALFAVPWILGVGALLGMIVAAVGLIRAGSVPLWEPILLIVAPIVTFFSTDGVLGAILAVPLAVVLIALAYEVLRMGGRSAAPASPDHIDLTDSAEVRDMPTPRAGAEPTSQHLGT